MKRVVVSVSLTLLTVAAPARVTAQGSAGTPLFSDALAAFDVASTAQVTRQRFVTPRFDVFEPGAEGPVANRRDRQLLLNLFPGTTFTATLDRLTVESREAFVWSGHLIGDVAGAVTLALRGAVMAGEVRTATALYEIRFAGGDAHVIRQVDPASFPPDGEPLEAPVDAAAVARADATPLADDGSLVDVLAVYTPSASAAAGGPAAIQALIDLAIANTNASYANSGVIQRIRLVHKAEIAYVETDFNTDLSRVTGTADGFMDNVHALRDAWRADLVALVINDGSSCGLAWVMNVNSTAFAPNGFSVNHFDCIAGNLTLAHEMGHNMSLAHDTSTPPGPFPYTYGRGYNNGTRRDVMAVASAQPRMQNFSNPAANFVGTAEPSGTADRNGALALNNTRMAVANFRAEAFQLTVTKNNGGTSLVTSSPAGISCGTTCAASFVSNTVVTLTATPAQGWLHGTWSGACSGTTAQTCQVTMSQARSVTVAFTAQLFQLTVIKANGGSSLVTSSPPGISCGSTCAASYANTTLVTLTASPASGWVHGTWSGACSATTANPCQVTMTQARSVTATFTALTARPTADLDGDGIDDLLLQHSTSWIGFWRMNGNAAPAGFTMIAPYDTAGWKVAARADLNGDGIGDIILQHTNTWVGAWLMDATGAPASFIQVVFANNDQWKVVGATDLNNDGRADIILQHANTWIGAWLMNGSGQPQSFIPIAFADNSTWKVVATADLNNDGIGDIVLQHGSSWVGAWLMNGSGQPASFVPVAFGDTLGWQVVGAADVNNDGIRDLLLQHGGSTFVGAWLLNAAGQITGFRSIADYNTNGWTVNGRTLWLPAPAAATN
jgi:hypothetical protein